MSITAIEGQGITTTGPLSTVAKIRKDEGELVVHEINSQHDSRDLLLLMNTKAKSSLPSGIRPGTIVFIADVTSSQLEGRALVFETMKDGKSPEDWQEPTDGNIINKGFVSLSSCSKTTGCSCLYAMLRRHLSRQNMHALGWLPLTAKGGGIRALVIIDRNQN